MIINGYWLSGGWYRMTQKCIIIPLSSPAGDDKRRGMIKWSSSPKTSSSPLLDACMQIRKTLEIFKIMIWTHVLGVILHADSDSGLKTYPKPAQMPKMMKKWKKMHTDFKGREKKENWMGFVSSVFAQRIRLRKSWRVGIKEVRPLPALSENPGSKKWDFWR